MKKISRILSLLMAMVIMTSAFGGLSISVNAEVLTLPYVNDFSTNTDGVSYPTTHTCSTHTAITGIGGLTIANGALELADSQYSGQSCTGIHTVEFNFEPQSSGILVAEFDYYVPGNAFYATDGLVLLENEDGTKVAGWSAKGRGTIYGVEDGAFGTTSVRTGTWNSTTYSVKIEVDLNNKKWSATGTKLLATDMSCNNASSVSRLKVVLMANGDSIDNLKIYKKVEAAQGDIEVNMVPGQSAGPFGNFTVGTAADAGMTYTSNDTNVATVDETTGVVTAVANGTCTITATSNAFYGITLTYTVNVTTPDNLITITCDSDEVLVGFSTLLECVVADGFTVDEITWSSDNTSVATVDNNGWITGISKGTANITASCFGGVGLDTYTVTVTDTVQQQALPYVNDFSTNTNGVSYSTSHTCNTHNAITGIGGLTIANGALELTGSQYSGTTCTGIHTAQLNFEPQSEGVLVAEFDYTVTTTAVSATEGLIFFENESGGKVAGWNAVGRGTLRPIVDGAFVSTKANSGSWTQSTYAVKIEVDLDNDKWSATVNQKWDASLTTNLSCNNAANVSKLKIVLTANGDSIDNVKIYKKVVATQTVSEYNLSAGDTQQLGISYSAGSAEDLTFTSNDTSVATVDDNGNVTTLKNGKAVITAVNEMSGVNLSFLISVTSDATKLTIDQKDRILYIGETFRLTYSVPKYTNDVGAVTWSSSNQNVATVTNKGIVTGIAEGVAVIKATSQSGLSASCTIEVVDLNKGTSAISVSNPGFESNLSQHTNWNPNGTPIRYPGGASGNYSLQFTSDSYVQQPFANSLEAGKIYTLSFMIKIDSLNEGAYAFVEVESTGYDQIASASYMTVTNGWEKKYVDFVVPKGCVKPKIFLRMYGTGEVYFDDVLLTKQKDMTEVLMFSDGLALNSIVSGAPFTTAKIRYIPKKSGSSQLIAAVYEGDELVDYKNTAVSGEQTLTNMIDLSKLDSNKSVGVMNWDSLAAMNPRDTKKTFLDKTQRSDVYNFFEINRMRGMYGGIEDIYKDDIKSLITEKGINTLILNIIGTFYGGNIRKDMTALNKVLDDAEKLAEETGVKIIPKIAYGDNATVSNIEFGEFHLGATMTANGTVYESSNAPCPRAKGYWKAQVTDILSEVAKHKKITGGVIDFEMYRAYWSSYTGSCMCNTCAADFDRVYGTSVAAQDITSRRQYVVDNKLFDAYNAWHKAEITAIASEVRESVHRINADFIFGYMARIEYIIGVTEGLGTQQMPVVIFNEQEYTGDLSHMYVNQASIKLKDLPAVYATGLFPASNRILPENFASKAVEAAKNSMGYWIYSSDYIVGTGNTEEDKVAYIDAIKAANDTIDNDYGL